MRERERAGAFVILRKFNGECHRVVFDRAAVYGGLLIVLARSDRAAAFGRVNSLCLKLSIGIRSNLLLNAAVSDADGNYSVQVPAGTRPATTRPAEASMRR